MGIFDFSFFFFFQAEDGIRDYKVTGVQTCALPISTLTVPLRAPPDGFEPSATRTVPLNVVSTLPSVSSASRSEEHTSELQSPCNLVCRLLLEKKKKARGAADQGAARAAQPAGAVRG